MTSHIKTQQNQDTSLSQVSQVEQLLLTSTQQILISSEYCHDMVSKFS